MKYVATKSCIVTSSPVGVEGDIEATDAELTSMASSLALYGQYPIGTADTLPLVNGTPVDLAAYYAFLQQEGGGLKPEPLCGIIVTVIVTALAFPAGADLTLTTQFDFQRDVGYTGGSSIVAAPVSRYVLKLTSLDPMGIKIGILPAQMVNGFRALSLPFVRQGDANYATTGAKVTITGMPAGVTANVKVLTRFDGDLPILWPDLAARVDPSRRSYMGPVGLTAR
jgi:hypothetical protein